MASKGQLPALRLPSPITWNGQMAENVSLFKKNLHSLESSFNMSSCKCLCFKSLLICDIKLVFFGGGSSYFSGEVEIMYSSCSIIFLLLQMLFLTSLPMLSSTSHVYTITCHMTTLSSLYLSYPSFTPCLPFRSLLSPLLCTQHESPHVFPLLEQSLWWNEG